MVRNRPEFEHADLQRDQAFLRVRESCQHYTMTPIERMYALYKATRYTVEGQIPRGIVECGVWKGGSAMVCAYTLNLLGDQGRFLHLYDTFAGMTEPTAVDVDYAERTARNVMRREGKEAFHEWCYASLDEVRANLGTTGYPPGKTVFVEGPIETTLPEMAPEQIALLRLDTDWFASTYHELQHLYPRLTRGGVIIIDDYGHWQGAQLAVDRYFRENNIRILLARIDYSCRLGIKMPPSCP